MLFKLLRVWRACWRSLEGPELEPRLWHSHFLTAFHSRPVLSRLGIILSGKVIDIGSGSGHGFRYLNPMTTEYWPTDLPSGRSAFDPAISRQGFKPAVHCSVYALPFEAASFDGALMLNVLEHLDSPAEGLKEVRRVLRPAGYLLFSVPFAFPLHGLPGDYRRWSGHGLRAELDAAGFDLLELRCCGGTFASLATNINLCLRYEMQFLMLLTPLLILLQGLLNALALAAESLLPEAVALPLTYVGLARKRSA